MKPKKQKNKHQCPDITPITITGCGEGFGHTSITETQMLAIIAKHRNEN